MKPKIAIVGGDLRLINLAEMLAKDDFEVYTYGLEKETQINENIKIRKEDSIKKAVKDAQIVIGPIPFSGNGLDINAPFSNEKISITELMYEANTKILIAGSISTDVYKMAMDEHIEIIDLMKREELAILNTIATAEGTIELAIANTNKILHGSKVLILGFGRIGKILSRKLIGLSAIVTCAARKDEDLTWIKTYGYNAVNINNIGENLKGYDIIINTVPAIILTEEKLKNVKKDTLIIDLASNPGGIDQKAAKEMNLKFIWALSLPGKVAPVTSAEFIKDTIYNVLKEIYNN